MLVLIGPMESTSLNWIVKGDSEGEYGISGKVTGEMSGGGQSFENTFVTKDAIKVLAGKALHLYISAEDRTWQNDRYLVNFELVNSVDRKSVV